MTLYSNHLAADPDYERAKQLTERVRRLEAELEAARREIETLLAKLDIYRSRSNETLNRRTT